MAQSAIPAGATLAVLAHNHDLLVHLIEQKYAFLDAVIGASMLWWVSMIVFLVSVMLGAFRVTEFLPALNPWVRNGVYGCITIALCLCPYYLWIARTAVLGVQQDVVSLESAAGLAPGLIRVGEFDQVVNALELGMCVFVFFVVAWVLLYPALRKRYHKQARILSAARRKKFGARLTGSSGTLGRRYGRY